MFNFLELKKKHLSKVEKEDVKKILDCQFIKRVEVEELTEEPFEFLYHLRLIDDSLVDFVC